MKLLVQFTFLVLLFVQCTAPKNAWLTPVSTKNLDLAQPADNLEAFIKMRCSLKDGDETTYYWSGTVYSFVPGERTVPLFGLEGCNIGKTIKIEGGYQFATRETAVYRDLKTNQILSKWYNPFIKDSVEVLTCWNDPVNQQFMLKGKSGGDWGVPYSKMGNGRVAMYSDVFLLYPSPLKKAEFPENTRSDNYQAAELFQFFLDEKELNSDQNSVYSEVGWTRISDFLPWMRMADRPGYLVYQCRGYKIINGQQLPDDFKTYIETNHPEFLHAPEKFSTPNMTSWKYFKAWKEKKQ